MAIVVPTKSGGPITLDTAPNPMYGFRPGQIVHFTKSLRNGKVALIRGFHEGLIWFSVFHNVQDAATEAALSTPVDSVSCRGKEELIRQYGWVVDDTSNLFATADDAPARSQ